MGFFKKWKNEIMSLFGKGTVIWRIPPEAEVVEAFEHDGVKYYQFATGFTMYVERYHAGIDRMNEIEMRCDKNYLDNFQKMLSEYLKRGDLEAIAILNHNLRDLRSYVCNVELMWNLASVWYFTADENPMGYDYEVADKKIKAWKKSKDLEAFFLRSPIMDFLPPMPTSLESTPDYIHGQRLKELLTLEFHLSRLSKESKDSELISKLKLQTEELRALISERYGA